MWLREFRNLIFVGTGCQTTGLSRFQNNFLNKVPNEFFRIFKIGLFCYENFPYSQFKSTIEEKCKLSLNDVEKMDIDRGKLIIYTRKGSIFEQPIKVFNSLVPEACKLCTNFTSEFADISVGNVGSPNGWSTVLVRTDAGESALRKAEETGLIEVKPLDEFKPGMSLVTRLSGMKKREAAKSSKEEE